MERRGFYDGGMEFREGRVRIYEERVRFYDGGREVIRVRGWGFMREGRGYSSVICCFTRQLCFPVEVDTLLSKYVWSLALLCEKFRLDVFNSDFTVCRKFYSMYLSALEKFTRLNCCSQRLRFV